MSEEKKDKVVKKEKAAKPVKKEKKPGRISKFWKDYRSEMKKVVWLGKEDLVKQTGVVLLVLSVAMVFLGVLDWSFTQLIGLIK